MATEESDWDVKESGNQATEKQLWELAMFSHGKRGFKYKNSHLQVFKKLPCGR